MERTNPFEEIQNKANRLTIKDIAYIDPDIAKKYLYQR